MAVYNASVSGVTATIFAIPEVSTWAMMAFGFAGLGMAGRLREWRTESRGDCVTVSSVERRRSPSSMAEKAYSAE